jgi:prepilin-type N-terminal cleavage/methylation domain-containing protein
LAIKFRRAFTLVEVLVVVVILGLLAGMIVPSVAGAMQDAHAGAIQSQLATLQRQIELYHAKHNRFPTFAGSQYRGWDQLINAKLMKETPKNPAGVLTSTQRQTVVTASGSTTGSATAGWVWNVSSKRIYASFFDERAGAADVTNSALD